MSAKTPASLVYWAKVRDKSDDDEVRLMVLSLERFCANVSIAAATLRLVSAMV